MMKTMLTAILLMLTTQLCAVNETDLERADQALESRDYLKAIQLYEQIKISGHNKNLALLGLAKASFWVKDLEHAETLITELVERAPEQVEHHFWAARIAGELAKDANVFSKIGLARDTKHHFTKALELDPYHVPSVIGLIKFHQQAPGVAGGDKEVIGPLIQRLQQLDPVEGFRIEVPLLLRRGQTEEAHAVFKQAISNHKQVNKLRYEFAMMLSAQGLYPAALVEMKAIDPLSVTQSKQNDAFMNMRLYQIAKYCAEAKVEFDLGLESIEAYMKLPVTEDKISADWIAFRQAQLLYLSGDQVAAKKIFKQVKLTTDDNALKVKMKNFLKTR